MRHRLRNAILRVHRSATGFTLVELIVSVAILTTGFGYLSAASFQVMGLERTWRSDSEATRQLRNAKTWFGGDAFNAEEATLLPDGTGVVLDWTDAAGSVTVTYSFDTTAETLVRTKDGLDFPVADDVVSVAFSLAGNILTLDLEIKASGGGTDTTTTQIFLRKGTP